MSANKTYIYPNINKKIVLFDRTKQFALIFFIFILSVSCLIYVYSSFPDITKDERNAIKIPRNIEDAMHLGNVLATYQKSYYYEVLFGFFLFYIFLQTFAIPGSIFLSILSGYLFPFPLALLSVCLCSTLGATCCYFLSSFAGCKVITYYFPTQIEKLSSRIQKHKAHLLNYIIFLRVTPILPNWLINLVSPIIGVPLKPYFWGTFLGVAPPSMLAIQMGQTIHTISSSGHFAISTKSIIFLIICASLSLAPILFKKRWVAKYD